MSLYISLRAGLVALVTAFALVPASALAVKPDVHLHEHFTDTFSIELCGIALEGTSVVNLNLFFYDEPGGDFLLKDTSSFRTTFTNAENGKSVIVSLAGQYISPPLIVDEEAGTFTFVESFKGLPLKIQTANGPILVRDAGVIAYQIILDLFTLELISREVIVNKGPHPDADGGVGSLWRDATLFCDVFTAALM